MHPFESLGCPAQLKAGASCVGAEPCELSAAVQMAWYVDLSCDAGWYHVACDPRVAPVK